MTWKERELRVVPPATAAQPPSEAIWNPACSDRPWPTLDAVAMRGVIGDTVTTISPESEADPAAIALELIAALGNCISAGPHMVADGAVHACRFYVCICGRSAKGRKGAAKAQAHSVMRYVDEQWTRRRVVSGVVSGEAMVATVAAPVDPEEENRGDRGDPRALFHEAEFARLLTIGSREGSTLSAVVRDAWDRSDLSIVARTNPVHAENAHVGIVGHITLDELRKRLTDTDTSNGFANRFLFAVVRRSQRLSSGGALTDDDYRQLARPLAEGVNHARRRRRVYRSRSAEARWADVYDQLGDDDPDGLIGTLAARAEPHVLRLSLLFALLDRSTSVEVDHIDQALAWWQYCRQSIDYVFATQAQGEMEGKLLDALREAGQAGLSFTEQHGVFGRNKAAAVLDNTRSNLEGSNLAISIGGKTKRSWAANPEWVRMNS